MTAGPGDDLVRMADFLDLRVPRADLDRDASQIRALLADQDTLLALPLDDQEPAFTPRLGPGRPGAEE